MIHCLNKTDDIQHSAVGDSSGNIASYGVRQSGLYVGQGKLFRPCAFSSQDIAVPLDKNMPCTQHVCKLPDFLGIGNRLIKRSVEIM